LAENRHVQGRSAVIALLLTGAVVVGCGSSSSGLSKQQLASKSVAICEKFNAKVKTVDTPSDLVSNHVAATHYFDQIAPLYDQAIAEFNKLKAAPDVQAQWSQVLSRIAAVGSLLDQVRTKADAGQPIGEAVLSQLQRVKDSAGAAAKSIGANKCDRT
jgi:hypothetical protein